MEDKIVYVLQDIPGSKLGTPKINILGASKFGKLKVLLPENAQIILTPGPMISELRQKLKNYRPQDYILCTGDPSVIGVACAIVSDLTIGVFNLLKWDKQEKIYYSVEINLFGKRES